MLFTSLGLVPILTGYASAVDLKVCAYTGVPPSTRRVCQDQHGLKDAHGDI